MRAAVALLVATLLGGCCAQFEDETKEYMGQYIGELNSYHHQVKRNLIFDAQYLCNRPHPSIPKVHSSLLPVLWTFSHILEFFPIGLGFRGLEHTYIHYNLVDVCWEGSCGNPLLGGLVVHDTRDNLDIWTLFWEMSVRRRRSLILDNGCGWWWCIAKQQDIRTAFIAWEILSLAS